MIAQAPPGPPTKRTQKAKVVPDTTPSEKPPTSALPGGAARPIGLCPDCGMRWTGTSAAHCAGCCEHFTSTRAFDRHRVDFTCLTPEELSRPGGNRKPRMMQTPRGWTTELMPEAVVAARAARGAGDGER